MRHTSGIQRLAVGREGDAVGIEHRLAIVRAIHERDVAPRCCQLPLGNDGRRVPFDLLNHFGAVE